MIYKFLKRIYPLCTLISLFLILAYAGTSDYYTNELHSSVPDFATTVIVWGVVFLIPSVLYVILDYIKDRYIDR